MKSMVRSLAVEMALQQRAMGRRIAELRERSRMTQEIAADQAGVTLRAYQKWEAGGGIQYANLQKLAKIFKVPVERITGEDSAPDPFKTSGQLDQIVDRLQHLEVAVQDQNDLLARQSRLLAKIETLVAGVPTPGELAAEAEAIAQAHVEARERSAKPKRAIR